MRVTVEEVDPGISGWGSIDVDYDVLASYQLMVIVKWDSKT